MSLSPETLALCLDLLGQVSLSALDPEIEDKVAKLVAARNELGEELRASHSANRPLEQV